MNILHIDSSITGENSASRTLSAAIVSELVADQPDAQIAYRDLVAQPLDHLTLGEFGTPGALEVMAQFKAADTIVLGTGMYNLSVPSQLKAWFDRIMIAGETFKYTESGPQGLAGGKRVIVALARGGFYGAESGARDFEFAERYIASVFDFIGVTDIRFIIAEGIAVGPEQRAAAVADAHRQIAELFLVAAE
ncbi:MAG: FMN-dependent NADH-azoreductase [Novosphingobium sp.]